jgi:hypothetical protein
MGWSFGNLFNLHKVPLLDDGIHFLLSLPLAESDEAD